MSTFPLTPVQGSQSTMSAKGKKATSPERQLLAAQKHGFRRAQMSSFSNETADDDHRLAKLIDRLPTSLAATVRFLRQPSGRWLRIPAGLLLMLGVSFFPADPRHLAASARLVASVRGFAGAAVLALPNSDMNSRAPLSQRSTPFSSPSCRAW
jgi:hypothetical protein